MKKSLIVVAALASVLSTAVVAGGSMGGNSVDMSNLGASWNGKAGKQVLMPAPARVEWFADACGTKDGEVFNVENCKADTEYAKRQTASK